MVLLLATGNGALSEGPVRILALGDSLTAGYGLPASDSFPVRLQAALAEAGKQAEVLNAGVSGDTTAGGLARLDWALAAKPNYAIVALGANDGLRAVDPEETYRNLDAILTALKSNRIPVLLAGMYAPPNLGREYGADFNAIYPQLAKEHDVMLYPFFLDGVAAVPRLNQSDGMHPNADGIDLMVERILPYVLRLIGDSPTG
ncbi:MAG: arylesterase [Alphaproteobacteria bacterium]|nr:arylesterase [Alphaproteobacteria bacterium]